ncbi:MAG: TetR family transcriptional regulator C-terminal domain-containing protein [Pseudomonadota bacterium]
MSAEGSKPGQQTRIQRRNREAILDAALDVFSQNGFGGASLELIANTAGLSKQNLIYYYGSKDGIHAALLTHVLEVWRAPLEALGPTDDPIGALVAYVLRKLQISRDLPRESRLFANEIVQGAPHLIDNLKGPLRDLVDEKAALIAGWAADGRIAPLDPHHLVFSIWATTQHYADFDVQVRGILAAEDDAHLDAAAVFLADFYRRALTPN